MNLYFFSSKYLPRGVLKFLRDIYWFFRLFNACFYDFKKFLLNSGLNKSRVSREQSAARLTLQCHQIEKGLSLSSPRAGFGAAIVASLIRDIDEYVERYGFEYPSTMAVQSLCGYFNYNERVEFDCADLKVRFESLLVKHGIDLHGIRSGDEGVIKLSKEKISVEKEKGFVEFFNSRYSTRHFVKEPVNVDDIRRAVSVAQKTPSVCNRQPWRVHFYNDPNLTQRILSLQGGNRGFGQECGSVLAVTCDLRAFLSVQERYESWIDGGMFAMALCLALHDLGYGACCLNWSKLPNDDIAMHSLGDIPNSEQIIMLIAVGVTPQEYNVAKSSRQCTERFLYLH